MDGYDLFQQRIREEIKRIQCEVSTSSFLESCENYVLVKVVLKYEGEVICTATDKCSLYHYHP